MKTFKRVIGAVAGAVAIAVAVTPFAVSACSDVTGLLPAGTEESDFVTVIDTEAVFGVAWSLPETAEDVASQYEVAEEE
ncbi:MAG: hypothetical protein BMS9Abin36_2218 [Gammaproteobacteria bacterium]|nr:MAG: hypothetical protein BMS9Abin36_2218 [Gammaproteobacteria bacterium]